MTSALLPADLEKFIREQGIDAKLVPMAIETPTVPAAAEALGVATGQIIKTLLFVVRDEPILVIANGDGLVDRSALAMRFGVGKKQVKLADAETVLRLTGYPVGGVPPFGHVTRLPVLLDRSVLRWETVYGGGGDDRTLIRVAPEELARATSAEFYET